MKRSRLSLRFRLPALMIALIAAAVGLSARPAHAQQPVSYAPERLSLRDVVDDLAQCNVQVSPDALLDAHAKYCQAYVELFDQLDAQSGRTGLSNDTRSGIIPTVKATQQAIQQRKQSVAAAAQMADVFLDELARSVAAEQQEAFRAYRDECQIRLLAQRIDSDSGAVTRTEVPFDLGAWVRSVLDTGDLSAEERARLAAARTAHHAQRLAAMQTLVQDVDEARLRAARLADELGIGGRSEDEVRQASTESGDQHSWESIEKVSKAAQLDPAARARMVAVEYEAWKNSAPLLPRAARWYAAATFVEVLAGSRGDLGRALNVPISVDNSRYAGGLSVMRTALSLPWLKDDERARVREIGIEWLDARTVLLEKACAAACKPDFSGKPDGAALVKLDTEFRSKIATAAKAAWLEVAADDKGYSQYHAPRSDLPKKEQLKLQPEDAAAFPLPAGGRSWFASGRPDRSSFQERRSGRMIAPAPDSETQMFEELKLTPEQDAVMQTLWADFRNAWETKVKAAQAEFDAATKAANARRKGGNSLEEVKQANREFAAGAREAARVEEAAWVVANDVFRAFADAAGAAFPGQTGAAARVWIESRRVDMGMPWRGWELSMPNLSEAVFSPWLSQAGSQKAIGALAESAPALSDSFSRVRAALHRTGQNSLAAEAEDFGDGEYKSNEEQRQQQLAATQREYLDQVQREVTRIIALLSEADAAAVQRAVDMQRYPNAFMSLREVIEALPETPENQAARAAVIAENERLMQVCDRAFEIARGLPEQTSVRSEMHGAITQLHARSQIYTDLARDMRVQALWRLRGKVPADVFQRVGLFRQAEAVGAVAQKDANPK